MESLFPDYSCDYFVTVCSQQELFGQSFWRFLLQAFQCLINVCFYLEPGEVFLVVQLFIAGSDRIIN